MLIIKNCNLINMAGIYEEKKDLVVEDGKILDICDNAVSKYNVGHVSIDACGHYVTPGFVEPHCQLGVRNRSIVLKATIQMKPLIRSSRSFVH